MENVYTNVLCIKLISLPTMNVKNILEQLKENLYCITIIPTCHLDTRSMKTIQSYQNTYGNWKKTLITIYSGASKRMHPHINVGQGNVTCV